MDAKQQVRVKARPKSKVTLQDVPLARPMPRIAANIKVRADRPGATTAPALACSRCKGHYSKRFPQADVGRKEYELWCHVPLYFATLVKN